MAQGRLFDMPEEGPDTRHPGQLSFPDWLKRGDTVFHSSFRPDWEEAPMAHVGSQVAASDRLVQSAVNIAPKESDDPRGGRTFSRRLAQPIAHISPSDAELNAAEWDILGNKTRTPEPGKVNFESDTRVANMAEMLRSGKPVGYKNSFEDVGTVSALAPKGTLRAWHQDVAEAQSMGLDVHRHDAALAKQQFDPAIAITPRSMASNVMDYKSRPQEQDEFRQAYPRNPVERQQTLFPASVGEGKHEVLFGIQPRDVDKDPWGERTPGAGATKRAALYAKESGEKLGYGVQPWMRSDRHDYDAQVTHANKSLEGLDRMERAHHEAIDVKRRAFFDKQRGW